MFSFIRMDPFFAITWIFLLFNFKCMSSNLATELYRLYIYYIGISVSCTCNFNDNAIIRYHESAMRDGIS